jgi:hypothetical protein
MKPGQHFKLRRQTCLKHQKQKVRKLVPKKKSKVVIFIALFVLLIDGSYYFVCRSYDRGLKELKKVQEEIARRRLWPQQQFYRQYLGKLCRQELDLKKKVKMTKPFYLKIKDEIMEANQGGSWRQKKMKKH